MAVAEARAREVAEVKRFVESWLREKGAIGDEQKGTFESEDGSNATYTIDEATDGDRSWWMVRLDERADDGKRFVTHVSVTGGTDRVLVFTTMALGSDAVSMPAAEANPRCPKLIRSLLDGAGPWYFGGSRLRRHEFARGFDEGTDLAKRALDPGRTVPVIVVSSGAHGEVLPRLAEKLALDVAGLANVVSVDDEASWGLTDVLGRPLTCFWGAVRLYWPKLTLRDDSFRHPLWSAQRLLTVNPDIVATRERFRRQVRGLVMHASVMGVARPREVDDIRGASSRSAFADVRARAKSLEDFEGLATLYAAENDLLRGKLEHATARLDELAAQVVDIGSERDALQKRAAKAEGRLQAVDVGGEIAPDAADSSPVRGEVRYYKKHFSHGGHDSMLPWHDCGCDKWESATKADKAKKGIAKAEGGRTDWRLLQHCASCTGGGVWKVKW